MAGITQCSRALNTVQGGCAVLVVADSMAWVGQPDNLIIKQNNSQMVQTCWIFFTGKVSSVQPHLGNRARGSCLCMWCNSWKMAAWCGLVLVTEARAIQGKGAQCWSTLLCMGACFSRLAPFGEQVKGHLACAGRGPFITVTKLPILQQNVLRILYSRMIPLITTLIIIQQSTWLSVLETRALKTLRNRGRSKQLHREIFSVL